MRTGFYILFRPLSATGTYCSVEQPHLHIPNETMWSLPDCTDTMSKRGARRQILGGCLAFVLSGAPLGAADYKRMEAEDPPRFFAALKEGKDHYFRRCFFCHGAHMDGRGPYASALEAPPPSLWGMDRVPERVTARGYASEDEAAKLALWITGYTGPDLRRSEKGDRGRRLYRYSCGQCHGYEGDGKGPAADLLDPAPRDLTRGTRRPARRAIAEGVRGTAMPAWRGIFSAEEIEELAAYVESFASGRAAPPEEAPLPRDAGSLRRGREAYEDLKCASCHGEEGRGDGEAGKGLKPANFRRGNASLRDLHRSFMDGIEGTPMEAYRAKLDGRRAWDLAYYLESLAEPRPPSKAVLAGRVEALPGLAGPEWEDAQKAYFPLIGEVLREPVHPSPSVDMLETRALHDGRELALLLEWDDRFPDPDPPLQRLSDAVEVRAASVLRWDSAAGSSAVYADGRWRVMLKAPLSAWGLEGRWSAPAEFSVRDGASRARSSGRRVALE